MRRVLEWTIAAVQLVCFCVIVVWVSVITLAKGALGLDRER
jgi:hypothetical protein